MKKVISLFLILGLVGCGTTSGRIGELPTIVNKESAAKVIVVRVSSIVGAANGYTISHNGKDVFGIGSGEYAEFFVPQGEHYIAAKCFGGWSPTWKEDSVKFVAKPSESNFFVVSPTMRCAEIKSSSDAETKKLLDSSKRIDLEKLIVK